MAYVLESLDEAKRLEDQALFEPYIPHTELTQVSLPFSGKVLDAGCGTGLMARAILSIRENLQVDACDFSDIRIQQAKGMSRDLGYSRINFFQEDLSALRIPSETYDFAISRYVFEHLTAPEKAMKELLRVLKPQGALAIVDFDGLILNLHSNDEVLMKSLSLLKEASPVDLFVGRKLPSLMKSAGFRNVRWNVTAYSFQGEALAAEYSQMDQRFRLARPLLVKIFGNEPSADLFHQRYLDALLDPYSCLFVNKFIVEGTK